MSPLTTPPRACLRILATLALGDGSVDEEERALIEAAARELRCTLRPADLEPAPLDELAACVSPELREGLLAYAARLPSLGAEQVAQVESLARGFGLPAPALRPAEEEASVARRPTRGLHYLRELTQADERALPEDALRRLLDEGPPPDLQPPDPAPREVPGRWLWAPVHRWVVPPLYCTTSIGLFAAMFGGLFFCMFRMIPPSQRASAPPIVPALAVAAALGLFPLVALRIWSTNWVRFAHAAPAVLSRVQVQPGFTTLTYTYERGGRRATHHELSWPLSLRPAPELGDWRWVLVPEGGLKPAWLWSPDPGGPAWEPPAPEPVVVQAVSPTPSSGIESSGRVLINVRESQICPFCRDGLAGVPAAELMTCKHCQVVFHRECIHEARSCSTLGCKNQRRRR